MNRVWKGIFGIQDLTQIRCGIRENTKYIDGIRDLTAPREAGLAKIWTRDAEFFWLSVGNSRNRHYPKKCSSGEKINHAGERNLDSPFKPNYRMYLVNSYLIGTVK